jgi:hypothetical protein
VSGQTFDLGEGTAEDRITLAVPARTFSAVEIEDPAGALATVERGDEVAAAVLQSDERGVQFLLRAAAAVADHAYEDGTGQDHEIAQRIGMKERLRLMRREESCFTDQSDHHYGHEGRPQATQRGHGDGGKKVEAEGDPLQLMNMCREISADGRQSKRKSVADGATGRVASQQSGKRHAALLRIQGNHQAFGKLADSCERGKFISVGGTALCSGRRRRCRAVLLRL